MKSMFKKIERAFFDVLKFDLSGYNYVMPASTSAKKIRLELLDGYFQSQPGLIRNIIIKIYLFIKKSILFVLRRLMRRGNSS